MGGITIPHSSADSSGESTFPVREAYESMPPPEALIVFNLDWRGSPRFTDQGVIPGSYPAPAAKASRKSAPEIGASGAAPPPQRRTTKVPYPRPRSPATHHAMRSVHLAPLRAAAASERTPPAAGLEYVLTVACVYQDESAREWARQVCARVSPSAGPEALRFTEWRIGDLGEPGVFADAVSGAVRADVIVIAVQAAEELPDDLYAWVIAWLRRRPRVAAALVALLSLPDQPGPPSHRAQDYLRAVARASALDFFTEERKLPVEPPASSRSSFLDEDFATGLEFNRIPEKGDSRLGSHYGIDE